MLQVLRSIRHAEANSFGQSVNAARPLRQLFDQFYSVRVTEGLGYLGQRCPDGPGGSAA
jgi:hypothetical protein